MALTTRRVALAGGTLAAGLFPRKPRAARLPDLAAVLKPFDPPKPPPDFSFQAADGTTHRLDTFQGRGMVINFWATWCAPCVAEMPSLEILARALAPHDIAVLPLSSDRGGAATVGAWFKDHEVTGLPVLLDPKGEAARAFEARGIPMTVIINRKGLVRARLDGAADWSADGAVNLIRALVQV